MRDYTQKLTRNSGGRVTTSTACTHQWVALPVQPWHGRHNAECCALCLCLRSRPNPVGGRDAE